MLFSNFVATIRADLDAIKDDLGEFVTTVKTDTSAMLGLAKDGDAAPPTSSTPKYLQWEEELWENPDLLCEDPEEEGWEQTVQVKEEEIESLLSGTASDVIPELYRELVPSRVTHADFFKRLIFYKNKLNQMLHNRVQELSMNPDEEEETRWDEDDDLPLVEPAKPVAQQESLPPSANIELQQELDKYKEQMEALHQKVAELEQALKHSEEQRVILQSRLEEQEREKELPHKKFAAPAVDEKVSTSTIASMPSVFPPVPSPSWEALNSSPDSTSNEEPVVISSKTTDEEEDDEEDDWE